VGTPFSGAVPRLKVNDGTCPEKPDHLNPTMNNYVKQPNQLIEIHTCHGVKEVKFCST
jgi:hypothetical protein